MNSGGGGSPEINRETGGGQHVKSPPDLGPHSLTHTLTHTHLSASSNQTEPRIPPAHGEPVPKAAAAPPTLCGSRLAADWLSAWALAVTSHPIGSHTQPVNPVLASLTQLWWLDAVLNTRR